MDRARARARKRDPEVKGRPVAPSVLDGVPHGHLHSRIAVVASELRPAITTILESIAGPRPRPTRLSRAVGLDKSLASRLARTVRATTDLDLMHLVPSPGGLRIFADLFFSQLAILAVAPWFIALQDRAMEFAEIHPETGNPVHR